MEDSTMKVLLWVLIGAVVLNLLYKSVTLVMGIFAASGILMGIIMATMVTVVDAIMLILLYIGVREL